MSDTDRDHPHDGGDGHSAAGMTLFTFKADPALAEALRAVPNRSLFIRTALLAALDSACPLCQGTGVLTLEQRGHWEAFVKHHPLRECGDCSARHPVCDHEHDEHAHDDNVGGRVRT
jgi:hypothetical protein